MIAGAGSNSTSQAIELAKDAEAAGADAVLSVVPYYNKPIQSGMYAHFRAIAEATGLPIILYDVPSRTVCGLADDTDCPASRAPAIHRPQGRHRRRDATAAPASACLGPEFRLLSGDDATALAFIAQGGDGCISVTSNVAPGLCRSHVSGAAARPAGRGPAAGNGGGDVDRRAVSESNPAPVKYALSLFGVMSPRVRLPLVELKPESKAEIDTVMAQMGAGDPGYILADAAGRDRGTVRSVNGARLRPKLVAVSP